MRLGILASAYSPFPTPGHLWAMKQALDAGVCDGILAALHIDPSVDRPSKLTPPLSIAERMMMVSSVRYVESVASYRTEAELHALMAARMPAVVILGEDHRGERYTGDDLGLPVFYGIRRIGWSGTEFARRTAESYADWQRRQSPCPTT